MTGKKNRYPIPASTVKHSATGFSRTTTTMIFLSTGLLSFLLAWSSLSTAPATAQDGASTMDHRGCPVYSDYSTSPHGDRSAGPLGLPFMRPEERCRTFNSSAVEVGRQLRSGVTMCACTDLAGRKSSGT